MRREDTVETDQRMPRRWNQGAEPAQKIERRHHAAELRLLPGPADAVHDHAIVRDGEPLETQRRAGAVADEARAGGGIALG
jgi:hypothetical protein